MREPDRRFPPAFRGIFGHRPLLAAWRAAADWADQRVSGPFIARADFRLDEYDALFVDLAQLQNDLSHVLAVDAAREPVELYLFQTQHAYRTFLEARLPQVPYRRALFVKGRGPGKVFAYKSKDLPVDVRHEGTHGLLHAALPMVPLWLDEGLAEYFEVPAASRAYANPHLFWTRADVRLTHITPLTHLEAKRDVAGDERHRLSTRLGLDPLFDPRAARGSRRAGQVLGRYQKQHATGQA